MVGFAGMTCGPCYGPRCHMVPQRRSCASKGWETLPVAGSNADMPRFGASNAAGRGRYVHGVLQGKLYMAVP
jgi:hypothetical protein